MSGSSDIVRIYNKKWTKIFYKSYKTKSEAQSNFSFQPSWNNSRYQPRWYNPSIQVGLECSRAQGHKFDRKAWEDNKVATSFPVATHMPTAFLSLTTLPPHASHTTVGGGNRTCQHWLQNLPIPSSCFFAFWRPGRFLLKIVPNPHRATGNHQSWTKNVWRRIAECYPRVNNLAPRRWLKWWRHEPRTQQTSRPDIESHSEQILTAYIVGTETA